MKWYVGLMHSTTYDPVYLHVIVLMQPTHTQQCLFELLDYGMPQYSQETQASASKAFQQQFWEVHVTRLAEKHHRSALQHPDPGKPEQIWVPQTY